MRFAAIVLMAGQLVGSPLSAVHAHAWTADSLVATAHFRGCRPYEIAYHAGDGTPAPSPFPVVEVPPSNGHRHRGALISAVTGLGLIGASFAWHEAANRRYDEYLNETDPDAIESRWNAVKRADRWSTSSLIAGEVLLATAVYLRFVRPGPRRVAVAVSPARAALVVRW